MGLGAGMVFRTYSGYPINETTGVDSNGDGTSNDRPIKGVNDLTRPILSPRVNKHVDGECRQGHLDAQLESRIRITIEP